MKFKFAKIAKFAKAAGACAVAALSVFLAASWLFIGWTDDGADVFPGGIVLRDSAGRIIRVSLGPGDVDCRPHYRASPAHKLLYFIIVDYSNFCIANSVHSVTG